MKEYSHYYKEIPKGVKYIDVYRVLEMFDVTNPSIQHAIKKLLVAGGRGHKDIQKDIKEAVDSLNRWIEMREEESLDVPVKGPVGTDYTGLVYDPGLNGPAKYEKSGQKCFGNN